MRRLLCLTLVLMAAAVVTTRTLSAGEEDLRYERFDVSVIIELQRHQRGARLGAGAPLEREDRDDSKPPKPSALSDIHELVELVRIHVEPASWENIEGASVNAHGHWLLVRTRPAVVKRVEAFLYELTLEAQRRLLFSIEVTKGAGEGFPKLSVGTAVAMAGSVEVPFGVERLLTRTSRVQYVADYEVEIAQGSNISNPTVMSADEGLLASVIATPSIDGESIVVEALVQTAAYGTSRLLSLGTDEESLPNPYRSNSRSTYGTLELPVYEHTQLHFTIVVPASASTFSLPIAVRGRMVQLRLNTRGLGSRGPRRLIDLGTLAERPMSVVFGKQVDKYESHLFAPRVQFTARIESRPCFGDSETILEEIGSIVEPTYWEQQGFLMVVGPSRIYVRSDDSRMNKVRTFLAELERQAVQPVVVNVKVWSMPGAPAPGSVKVFSPEGGRLVAAGTLPTIVGRRASLMAGSTANYVADYDVEVAQDARIGDPIVGQAFDGLVVNLRPRLSPDKRTIDLDLQMLLAGRTIAERSFESGAIFLGQIDHVRQDRRVVDTRLQIPVGNTHLIDLGVDPENKDRRLVAAIHADLGSVGR